MSSVVSVGKSLVNLTATPQFDGYSKVVIKVTDDLSYEVGTDTGRTLTMTCPWGTRAMAENILAQIKGYKYQPYTATGALIDPAAEIGDAVSIKGIYSGIFSKDTKFGGLCAADLSAPSDEEIDHEYPYKDKQERQVTRQIKGLTESYASLSITADGIKELVSAQGVEIGNLQSEFSVIPGQISAKVDAKNENYQSFGWELKSDSWTIKSNSTEVLKATKDGLNVTGKITATGGTIGGFSIKDGCLSTNGQTWKGTNETGIYIGPEGLQLGKNFRVTNTGALEATDGTFSGTVSASSIKYGKSEDGKTDYGTLSGGAITNGTITSAQVKDKTLGTTKFAKTVNDSLGYANFSNDVFNGKKQAAYTKTKIIDAKIFYFNGYQAYIDTITYLDASGTANTATVLKAIRL